MTLFPDISTDQPAHAITLYDYQVEDRAKIVDAFLDRRQTRLLGVWPTGAGKTVCFSELHLETRLNAWLSTFPPDHRQILILAHRDELISQAVTKIGRSNPDLTIGVEKAASRSSRTDDIVVASVQTLSAGKGKRLRSLDPERFRIVVVDEAHHAPSPSYTCILQHFGFLPDPDFFADIRPTKDEGRAALLSWQRARLESWDRLHGPDNRLLLGVTATAIRGDKVGLECVFKEVVFERSIREMMDRGRLCGLRAYRVQSDVSLDEVGVRAGDFELDKLSETINVDTRNTTAVKAYLELGQGRKGITFCATIAHAMAMAKAYRDAGVQAAVVYGAMPLDERRQVLAAFSRGEIRMLTNMGVLVEGYDEPDIQCIIHARPTKSQLLYIQMSGRGLRIAPGKEDCLIIDIVDVTKKHSLMTSPELLGLPANFDAKGENLLSAKKQLEAISAQFPLAKLDDVTTVEQCQLRVAEVDLLSNFRDDVLDAHSTLAWERTGEGYEISWRGQLLNEFALVAQDPDGRWKFSHKRGHTSLHTAFSDTPQDALAYGEKWLYRNKPSAYGLNQRNKSDNALPATGTQKDMIRKFAANVSVDRLSRGEAQLVLNHHYAKQRRYAGTR